MSQLLRGGVMTHNKSNELRRNISSYRIISYQKRPVSLLPCDASFHAQYVTSYHPSRRCETQVISRHTIPLILYFINLQIDIEFPSILYQWLTSYHIISVGSVYKWSSNTFLLVEALVLCLPGAFLASTWLRTSMKAWWSGLSQVVHMKGW